MSCPWPKERFQKKSLPVNSTFPPHETGSIRSGPACRIRALRQRNNLSTSSGERWSLRQFPIFTWLQYARCSPPPWHPKHRRQHSARVTRGIHAWTKADEANPHVKPSRPATRLPRESSRSGWNQSSLCNANSAGRNGSPGHHLCEMGAVPGRAVDVADHPVGRKLQTVQGCPRQVPEKR